MADSHLFTSSCLLNSSIFLVVSFVLMTSLMTSLIIFLIESPRKGGRKSIIYNRKMVQPYWVTLIVSNSTQSGPVLLTGLKPWSKIVPCEYALIAIHVCHIIEKILLLINNLCLYDY
ncbi:hypothetical protein NE237_005280 [Protea cynaroides]|uniref:Uncharacterized protein n=1 Tax=Protea cynaroides TaxID=273540 RepID=A0A9Q0KL15_9MAGN|nr:hypothetical protein NE237_005280 [Protea cynaroides]